MLDQQGFQYPSARRARPLACKGESRDDGHQLLVLFLTSWFFPFSHPMRRVHQARSYFLWRLSIRAKKLGRRPIEEPLVQFDEQGAQLLLFLLSERGKERLDMEETLRQDLVKKGECAGSKCNRRF